MHLKIYRLGNWIVAPDSSSERGSKEKLRTLVQFYRNSVF